MFHSLRSGVVRAYTWVLYVRLRLLGAVMPLSMTHRISIALPILFYLLALVALWLHWPTADGPLLVVAVLAGALGIGIGMVLVRYHNVAIGRVSSGV